MITGRWSSVRSVRIYTVWAYRLQEFIHSQLFDDLGEKDVGLVIENKTAYTGKHMRVRDILPNAVLGIGSIAFRCQREVRISCSVAPWSR